MDDAVMMAEHASVQVDDLARPGGAGPQSLDDLCVMPCRHETDVLAVLLVGDGKPEAARQFAGFRLGTIAEREAQEIKLRLCRGKQKIALVASAFARAIKRAAAVRQGPRRDVMAGRQNGGAEIAGGPKQVAEFYRLIACDTGHR